MRSRRGFTLLELMMVLAIVAILAALAFTALYRSRPRARLAGATTDLVALLRAARQNALSTSNDTVVMVFPGTSSVQSGLGRVLVREDPAHTFFQAASSPNFGTFDPTSFGATDNLFGTLELPRDVGFGFGGLAAPTLDPPYASIPVAACSFCAGSPSRGAIVFDSRGRARFYSGNGSALAVTGGGTVALQGSSEIEGYRLLVITAGTGSVRVMNRG